MPAVPAFTPAENDRMRKVVQMLKDRLGSQQRVADALGLSQPAVGAFLDSKYGFTKQRAEKLAALADMSLDHLLGRDGMPLEESADEYPNRQPVLDFAQRIGYPSSVIRKLRAAHPRSRADVPSTEWARLLFLYALAEASPFTEEPADAPKAPKARKKRQK